MSVFGGDVRFVEDLASDWPDFFAPGVARPARAAVVEFRAPQAILSTDHPSLSVWIREVLARLLASEAALPALEIVLNSGVYNEVHKRLGICTTLASQFERGVRVADAATRSGNRLLMGGIRELDSAQDVADQLAATNGGYGRAFISFPRRLIRTHCWTPCCSRRMCCVWSTLCGSFCRTWFPRCSTQDRSSFGSGTKTRFLSTFSVGSTCFATRSWVPRLIEPPAFSAQCGTNL